VSLDAGQVLARRVHGTRIQAWLDFTLTAWLIAALGLGFRERYPFSLLVFA
jgi:hypothetical protein